MQMFVLEPRAEASAISLSDAHVRVICREITMLLSTWYYHHGPAQGLPYKPMSRNQPLIQQFNNPLVRRWAIHNAGAIFNEFEYRFDKKHASESKFNELLDHIQRYDIFEGEKFLLGWTFVGKDIGIEHNLTIEECIEKYRKYYADKINSMKVPCTYTSRRPPAWLEDILTNGIFEKKQIWAYKKF